MKQILPFLICLFSISLAFICKVSARQTVQVGDEFSKYISQIKINETGHYSAIEDFYRLEDQILIVWNKGRRAGQISQIYEAPSAEQLKSAITQEEFLRAIDPLVLQGRGQRDELTGFIRRAFDGDDKHLGLRISRFYDLEINNLINEMDYSGPGSGLDSWLQKRAKNLGFTGGEISYGFSYYETPEATRYFFLKDKITLSNNTYFDESDPIIYTHGTYSSVISGILSERGLADNDERNSDIPKLNGVHASKSSQGGVSFFTSLHTEPAEIRGGYGHVRAFEYPVVFGIGRSRASLLNSRPGSSGSEQVLSEESPRVSLDKITHIFVPYFRLKEVEDQFRAHGYENIKFLPLGFSKNQPMNSRCVSLFLD